MSASPSATPLSQIPLYPNPNGGPSNFVNPPTLLPAVFGVGVTMIVVSGICLILRLWANVKKIGRLCIDDYLCIFAESGGIAYWAVIYTVSLAGTARHSWDVPVSIVTPTFIKLQYVQQTIIAPTMWAAKASIFALYIRLFSNLKWLRWSCYGLMIFTALVFGTNIILAAVFCTPHDGDPWNVTTLGHCSKPVAIDVVIGVFTVAADIALFALPFPIIWRLNLNKKTKTGLVVVFFFGLLTVITSVASLVYRVLVFRGHLTDPIWIAIKLTITTFTEVFGTIIVSCTPGIASFWHNILKPSPIIVSLQSYRSGRKARSILSSPAQFADAIDIAPYITDGSTEQKHNEKICRTVSADERSSSSTL